MLNEDGPIPIIISSPPIYIIIYYKIKNHIKIMKRT